MYVKLKESIATHYIIKWSGTIGDLQSLMQAYLEEKPSGQPDGFNTFVQSRSEEVKTND